MASIKKGILGGFSGGVGTVVGGRWKTNGMIVTRKKVTIKFFYTFQVVLIVIISWLTFGRGIIR